MPVSSTPPSRPGWPAQLRAVAGGTVAGAARWPWTARPCAAPVTTPVTGAAHLLAAIDQQARTALAQTAVDGKTNEITPFAPLLASLDRAGCVVTADALHTQREHAGHLVTGKKADYILVVEATSPPCTPSCGNCHGRPFPPPPAAASQRHRSGRSARVRRPPGHAEKSALSANIVMR
jgi:predicted transposase YbfD/YdcC